MVETRDPFGEDFFDHFIETLHVRWRPNLVEVQRRWFLFGEPRLDPINRSGVPIEADSHRQRDSQYARIGALIHDQAFGLYHRFSVDRHWIRLVSFDVAAFAVARKN